MPHSAAVAAGTVILRIPAVLHLHRPPASVFHMHSCLPFAVAAAEPLQLRSGQLQQRLLRRRNLVVGSIEPYVHSRR